MSKNLLHLTYVTDMAGVDSMFRTLHRNISPLGLAGFLQGVVDPYLRRRAKQRFASEGDDASGKWEQLAPATVKIRQALGFPGAHPINRRTGQLESFITERPGRIGQEATFTTLTLPGDTPTGELLEKFETAQLGKESRRSYTPDRPVLALSERDTLAVITELAFYVTEGGRRGDR